MHLLVQWHGVQYHSVGALSGVSFLQKTLPPCCWVSLCVCKTQGFFGPFKLFETFCGHILKLIKFTRF